MDQVTPTLPLASVEQLGYQPSSAVGTKSLDEVRQQFTTSLELLNHYDPGGINQSNMGTNSIGTDQIQNLSVTNEKVKSITFDKAQGGTLVLGGLNNVNGLLEILDANKNIIIKADNLGTHYYDLSGNLLVTIDDIGFHAYDTSGNQLTKVDSAGFHTFTASGQKILEISPTAINSYGRTFQLLTTGGVQKGLFGVASTTGDVVLASTGSNKFELEAATELDLIANNDVFIASADGDIILGVKDATKNIRIGNPVGNIYINGSTFFIDDNTIIGNAFGSVFISSGSATKTAIVPTSQGYRALYTNESPEVWFNDFCKGHKKRKWPKFWKTEWIIEPDPMFLEVTSAPYIIMPTLNPNIVQIWGHRKGFEKTRFEKKTKKQFDKNNAFWSTPHKS